MLLGCDYRFCGVDMLARFKRSDLRRGMAFRIRTIFLDVFVWEAVLPSFIDSLL